MDTVDKKERLEVLSVTDVADFLGKSSSWVYKNWKEIGGVKLGGSLLFPSKEILYERLFEQKQEVEVRLHHEGAGTASIHPNATGRPHPLR